MKVLVLGSGGREHALAWKIKESPSCTGLFLHPGNPGTKFAGIPALSDSQDTSLPFVIAQAKEKQIDLVVIGPEALLAEGYADELRKEGFKVVGPNKDAARLETSKVFAKEFMTRAKVPTADFIVAEDDRELLVFAGERNSWPVVLKLDGLAAGKGVVIAKSQKDIEDFASRIWGQKEFGKGPHRVLIEEFIEGVELSYIGLCDGETYTPFASATDFKRVGDDNTGPNTGGMGSISPSPYYNEGLNQKIHDRIVNPILAQLKKEGIDYRGALYIGIMIDAEDNPYVLEFNTRFGDPETQALMLRLESDFITLLDHTARGALKDCPPATWSKKVSVYVVAAAHGYPGKVRTGDYISGTDALEKNTQLFYSGVKQEGDALYTAGGRVLGVGMLAPNFAEARGKLYNDLKKINWNGIHYRKDIGG